MVPLVDADGLVYLAGFATQKTYYDVQVFEQDGLGPAYTFSSHAEMQEAMAEETKDYTITKSVEVEPVSHALQICKNKLSTIQNQYGAVPQVFLRADEQRNYRDHIAQVVPYKGNRSNEKPAHYQAIRDYLCDTWGAITIFDREVDDEVSILSWQRYAPYCVICSPDKDLDQIPGHHYNYRDETHYHVDEADARRWFWIQALAGDSSDNVPGCWKVGVGKATKLVDEWLDERLKDEQIWEKVVEAYEHSLTLPTCPYLGREAEDVAIEMTRLIYMQRDYHELWTPPGYDNLDTKALLGESLDD